MSESQTWDNNALFMFQCEGSNSHIETYKYCMLTWVDILFLDSHGTAIFASDTFELSLAILTSVPGKNVEK